MVSVWERRPADNSATSQVKLQGFELVHPIIYLIYGLLEYGKGSKDLKRQDLHDPGQQRDVPEESQ